MANSNECAVEHCASQQLLALMVPIYNAAMRLANSHAEKEIGDVDPVEFEEFMQVMAKGGVEITLFISEIKKTQPEFNPNLN